MLDELMHLQRVLIDGRLNNACVLIIVRVVVDLICLLMHLCLWTCHSTILFCCLLDCFGCEHVILELLLCEPTLVV